MFKVEANLKEIASKQLTQRARAQRGRSAPAGDDGQLQSAAWLAVPRPRSKGHSFISDEGDEAGGHDAGPAPLRYFLAGIMMCHQVWCVKSAAVADVQLDNLQGEISGFVEAGGSEARRGKRSRLRSDQVYGDNPKSQRRR